MRRRVGCVARSAWAAGAGLALSAMLVTGCTPQPDPEESREPFGTEEEAFAAAEETYRNYVDALNARRESPAAEPDPQSFLIGPALEADIRSQQEFDQQGIRVEGPTMIVAVVPKTADLDANTAELLVCLDSSATRVIDEDGNDVTPEERAELAALNVGVVLSASRTRIESSDPTAVDEC